MVPPWAANEAGIFKKYGLQVEVIATPSGIQGTNALIANELSFLQIAGGTTTGAAVGIRDDPDLVRRYLSAQIEAIALLKKDRSFALKVLSKYLRSNDMDLLNESYDIQIAKYMQKVPLTTADAVRSVLDELTERNPKAKDLDPTKFFDDRFVRDLQAGDFFDSLYR